MKKFISIVLFLVTTVSFAQNKFELTPEGFKNNGKDYLVIEVPNKSAEELYKSTKIYLTGLYKSAKDVISEVEGKMITVNGNEGNKIRRNSMHVFDINYNLTFRFKEGKVRVDAPTFKLTTFNSKWQTLHLVWTKFSLDGSNLGIYGRRGKLKSKKAKADLENFFNTYIKLLKEYYTSEEEW